MLRNKFLYPTQRIKSGRYAERHKEEPALGVVVNNLFVAPRDNANSNG